MKTSSLSSLLSTGKNFSTQGHTLHKVSSSLLSTSDHPRQQKIFRIESTHPIQKDLAKCKRARISEKALELDKTLEYIEKYTESVSPSDHKKILEKIFEVFGLVADENGQLQVCMQRITEYLKKSIYFEEDNETEERETQLKRFFDLHGKTSKPNPVSFLLKFKNTRLQCPFVSGVSCVCLMEME